MQPNKFNRGRLKFTTGDPSTPEAGGFKYILQANNDNGNYDHDAPIKKWPSVQTQYRHLYLKNHGKMALGSIDTVHVQSDTVAVNLITQHVDEEGKVSVNYDDLRECLKRLGQKAVIDRGTIHAPRLCLGAGADWKEVEKIIDEELIARGLNVTIYDRPAK